jgi:hypothetical protein
MATPERIVARVYLSDEQILRQVGLNNAYKTLLLTSSSTPSNTTSSMLKAMCKGMHPADKNVIEVKCSSYAFFVTLGKKERAVDANENLFSLWNNATKAKKKVQLSFKAPPSSRALACSTGSRIRRPTDSRAKPTRKGSSASFVSA